MPNVSGTIKTFAEADIYATGDANRQSLGFHSVNSILERNQIPLARRRGTYESGASASPKPFFVSVRIGSVVTLYWLKNEPGTSTTTDSDWEQFIPSAANPFKGFFNAATAPDNSVFTNGVGNVGDYWIASVAGSYSAGAGDIVFAQYDKAQYDGTLWQKVGGSTAVADWNTMINKPSVFPPEVHNHPISDITNLQPILDNKLEVDQLVNTVTDAAFLAPSGHAVIDYAYSRGEVDIILSNLATYGIKFSWVNLTQQNAQTGQVVGDLGLRNDEQKVYRWNGTSWLFFFSLNTAGAQLTENVTSKVNVGNIVINQLLSAGLSFTEFVKKLVVKITYPTYTQPTGSISTSSSTTVEIGSIISPLIVAAKNDGDSGGIYNYTLKRGVTTLVNASGISNYTDVNYAVNTSLTTYTATMSFSEGAVKYDDDTPPQPYPTGKILDTTITTNSINISGVRALFYDTSKPTTTSSDVRALVNKILNPINGITFTVNIAAGATSVEFAYPATLEDVFKVLDNGTNLDIKGAFTQTIVSVQGANAFAGINYKVYRFDPVSPYSQNGSYTITI